MHERLRLRGPHVEHSSRIPQQLQDHSVILANIPDPTYEAGIEIEAFHADVFFDTDGQAMEWADGFLVLSVVLVEFCCAC